MSTFDTDTVSLASLRSQLAKLQQRTADLSTSADLAGQKARLSELAQELESNWGDRTRTAQLMREQSQLSATVEPLSTLESEIAELAELVQLAGDEKDSSMLGEIARLAQQFEDKLEQADLHVMLSGSHDQADCFIDIQFGSGGDESQDWARMLCRMYAGYASFRNWRTTVIEETIGDHGIKSCTMLIAGPNAYGYLRTETGIHRLVRKSPFDSNHRRHTTFASVFAYPVIEKQQVAAINPADLRIDTYRASGAGGQHVNTTDSAVRVTHIPTGIVVQCQNDRSQHKNRSTAMSMLQSRLELLAEQQADEQKRKLDAGKDDISWGSQIRSYVLDQSRVKDLRTGEESGNPQAVLDGNELGRFIEAALRKGV